MASSPPAPFFIYGPGFLFRVVFYLFRLKPFDFSFCVLSRNFTRSTRSPASIPDCRILGPPYALMRFSSCLSQVVRSNWREPYLCCALIVSLSLLTFHGGHSGDGLCPFPFPLMKMHCVYFSVCVSAGYVRCCFSEFSVFTRLARL